MVQERLGHSSIAVTIDTYRHVLPGTQAAAAKHFDQVIISGLVESWDIKKPREPSGDPQFVGFPLAFEKEIPPEKGGFESEPQRNRTSNLLIKRHDPPGLLDTSESDLDSPRSKFGLVYYLMYYLVPYGISKFVGKMLAKILLLIESLDRR
ncbi:hypothetical protein ACFLWS_07270 [Chloroflexota bacterium]